MKRIVAYLLVLCMLSLASCGGDSEIVPDATDTAETTIIDETTFAPDETTGDSTENESVVSVPREYLPVIENYERIVKMRLSESFQENWNNDVYRGTYEGYYDDPIMGDFDTMIIEMLLPGDDVTASSYGYVLQDINGDDVSELFWVSSDLSTIFAVFTMSGMDVQLLDAFWSRYQCCVTDKGELYTRTSSGSDVISYHIRKLEPHSADPVSVKEFGSDRDEAGEQFYYEAESFGADYISKERFEELLLELPFENGKKWMKNKVNSLPEYYYLTSYTNENLVSARIPDFGYYDLVSDYVTTALCDHYGLSLDFDLTKSEKLDESFYERFRNGDYTDYFIDIEARIKSQSESLISVSFEGMYYYSNAAHPNHILFSLNIDKKTGERMMFKDKYIINGELYKVFVSHAQTSIDNLTGDPELSLSVENDLCTYDTFMDGIEEGKGIYVYFTDSGIGFSYSVPNAIGGHQEVEIPFSELEEFKK